MAVAMTMQIPKDSGGDEDDLDLRWLEDRLSWAARLGDAAQALRDLHDEDTGDELEKWHSLQETAKLRCQKRRQANKLEKLEKRMRSVSSSFNEAQSHLASLTRERDLLKECVQELLLLTSSGKSGSEVLAAVRSGQRSDVRMAKGATSASLTVPAAATSRGGTPRSARSGGATPNALTVPSRRVRFDDKLMESPREPRVPLPPGHVWPNIPILKHRSMIAEPVTQEPTSPVACLAVDMGSARRSPSACSDVGSEAAQTMDSARIIQASAEPVVRQDQPYGQPIQLPRWAASSPPPAPQILVPSARLPMTVPTMPGQPIPVQPWVLQPASYQVSRPGPPAMRLVQHTL